MKAAFIRLCWIVPVLMLAANVLSWLRYGTDFPFYDDWRAYAAGDIRSLHPAHLFQVVNNTMSPVGFALDALAQRWLDGNTVAYQLLSMLVVLGGLLWLQWRLLAWALPDPLKRAVAFAFTVFMLQSATYWGEQNLAYQQALPLLLLLGSLHAIVVNRGPLWVLACVVAALGVLAGFSYISGAVSALVMGVILLLCHALAKPARVLHGQAAEKMAELQARVRVGGLALLLTGAAMTAVQLYATRMIGGADRSETFPVRWPTHPDFWVYLLGKLGRSFGAAFQSVTGEVAFALVMTLVLAGVLLLALRRLVWRGGQEPSDSSLWRLSLVYFPLAAAVGVYLALVAFGRAGFRDASIQSWHEVFLFAYQRFHFFWITLLLPWTAAALLSMLPSHEASADRSARRQAGAWAAVILLIVGWGVAGARGVFDVSTYYEQGRKTRAETIRCMSAQLGSGEPIMCPEFSLPGWTDWTPAYWHAREIGASFTKYFPLVVHQPLGQWMFEGSPEAHEGVRWHDAEMAGGGWRQGQADPQLIIEGGDAQAYAHCRLLEVRVRLRADQPGVVQVFYRPAGEEDFSELHSHGRELPATLDAPTELRFALESPRGFAPVIRIDPVPGSARFMVEDVKIGCGLRAP